MQLPASDPVRLLQSMRCCTSTSLESSDTGCAASKVARPRQECLAEPRSASSMSEDERDLDEIRARRQNCRHRCSPSRRVVGMTRPLPLVAAGQAGCDAQPAHPMSVHCCQRRAETAAHSPTWCKQPPVGQQISQSAGKMRRALHHNRPTMRLKTFSSPKPSPWTPSAPSPSPARPHPESSFSLECSISPPRRGCRPTAPCPRPT